MRNKIPTIEKAKDGNRSKKQTEEGGLAYQLFLKHLKKPLDISTEKFVPVSANFVFSILNFVSRISFFGGVSRFFVGKSVIKFSF